MWNPGRAAGDRADGRRLWRAGWPAPLALAAMAALGGCAGLPVSTAAPPFHLAAGGERAACAQRFAAEDARIARAGRGDGQEARIAQFAYLRVNRPLLGLAPPPSATAFDVWAEQLRRLDAAARAAELRNAGLAADPEEIRRCGRLLLGADLTDGRRRLALAAEATVPDDYSLAARAAGLYPLTSLPFMLGVQNLHAETRARFASAVSAGAVGGRPAAPQLIYAAPPGTRLARAEVARRLAEGTSGPLGVPDFDARTRQQLLETFAPVIVVEQGSRDDRIGSVTLDATGLPGVDVEAPSIYTRVSHTRFAGRTLVQLVYTVWFPARTATGTLDILAGRLDGLVWRVTLDEDGLPLVYDSMHPCGCYHMVLPAARPDGGARLLARTTTGPWEEPVLVPALAPQVAGPVVLSVTSGVHYLQGVFASLPEALRRAPVRHYGWRDADGLRSLALPGGGRRSLFRPDGIVAASERPEQLLFWPMGVRAAGAMRQWGRHAIAFIGRRHFDDPDLLDRWFVPDLP